MNKKILAIIPARGGSKGVVGKNIKMLLGKPLLAWTIEAAKKSSLVERVIVSTDSKEIQDVAIEYGAEAPFLRSSALAQDHVHSSVVITDCLDWLINEENYEPDAVLMLLPTSPFRTSEHIDEAIEQWRENALPAVVGVNLVNKHPAAFRVVDNDVLYPLIHTENLNVQRQDADNLYAVNGSLYLIDTPTFRKQLTFHVKGAAPYVLSKLNSIDIDSLEDFTIAEVLGEKLIPVGER